MLQLIKNNTIYTPFCKLTIISHNRDLASAEWGIKCSIGSIIFIHITKLHTNFKLIERNRMILEVDSIRIRNKELTADDFLVKDPIKLGVIHAWNNHFAILTTDSIGTIKKYQSRMPIVINGHENYFFNHKELDPHVFNQRFIIA